MIKNRWIASFSDPSGGPPQDLDFSEWEGVSPIIADQVVAAFRDHAASSTRLGRETRRRQLNKLRRFLMQENTLPLSLDQTTTEALDRFRAFVEPVESTRTSDWRSGTDTVVHACEAAGRKPPKFPRYPWAKIRERNAPELALIPTLENPAAVAAPGPPSMNRRSRSLLAQTPTATVSTNVVTADVRPSILQPTSDRLEIVFPARGIDLTQRIDLSPWCALGKRVAIQFAAAFLDMHRLAACKSRVVGRSRGQKLLGFLLLLQTKPAGLDQLTIAQLAAFKQHLEALPGEQGRRKHWTYAKRVIEHACDAAKTPVPFMEQRPWAGAFRRDDGRSKILTVDQVGAVLRACIKEMTQILKEAEDPDYDGPTLPNLFPFIVAFTFATLFNPDTATGMRRGDVRPDLFGRTVVIGRKPRAGQDQEASFSSTDDHICSPPVIIANVEQLTRGLRDKLPAEDNAFVFVGRMQMLQRSLAEVVPYIKANSSMHHYYRDNFCEKHELELFTLRDIRATGAALINRLFGGDLVTAQALMNHMSADTTEGYVRRDAQFADEIRLADQMEKRARFVQTGGARDVRGQPSSVQSAATPGFACADPYSPPAHLCQEPGLCAAYAACLTCPLASVDRQCPSSLAFTLRLRNQIRSGHLDGVIGAHRWTAVWKPRLEALETVWLPQFEPAAHLAAKDIRDVFLVPFPDLANL